MSEPATSTQSAASYDASTPAAPAASRFVWQDLMTTDPAKSLAFYEALFGWERRPFDMGPAGTYDMLHAGEVAIGGMMPLDPGQNIPSHWIPYISVDSVDAACAKADATGGKTCVPPTDIPNVGRFAVVEDPGGAVFSPFWSSSPAMPEPKNAPRGTFAWNELMTDNCEKASAFYAGLTGWTVETMDMGPMGLYWLFKRDSAFAAGMMQMPAGEQARPHWLPYVDVASCDESAAKAAELGARTYVTPTDIQGWGRFAILADPTGATFGILENKQPM